jgi:hypothetical protein
MIYPASVHQPIEPITQYDGSGPQHLLRHIPYRSLYAQGASAYTQPEKLGVDAAGWMASTVSLSATQKLTHFSLPDRYATVQISGVARLGQLTSSVNAGVRTYSINFSRFNVPLDQSYFFIEGNWEGYRVAGGGPDRPGNPAPEEYWEPLTRHAALAVEMSKQSPRVLLFVDGAFQFNPRWQLLSNGQWQLITANLTSWEVGSFAASVVRHW